ncbi:hypothetical protein BN2476_530017 [Paraburkholderia piptadeniae]|uniref:Uncharacterized protein n=1 Tax=Paraburkholderia piptadeniae TaxID=1701573 RepID=A0A1N7SIN9_9BURK|nr:hypothetical protein BN2476_530017 [Paraburkholderia piptadeniae]
MRSVADAKITRRKSPRARRGANSGALFASDGSFTGGFKMPYEYRRFNDPAHLTRVRL